MSVSCPGFAVVGHPNKGKSSIVAALALDDSVHISDVPGTTTHKRSFPLRVDGKVVYELFDTPGFQRARQVLAWLQTHQVAADKKHEVVQAFIQTHKTDPYFEDEVELLEPIMQGAAIIYVVDGSKPYGQEYEAEMEILRWTGQPSMALINPIDTSDYTQEWKRALAQYFKMVRTFNPMKADFTQHRQLLESMSQLNEEWIAPMKASITLLETYHEQRIAHSAQVLAELVYTAIRTVEKLPLQHKEATNEEKKTVEARYKDALRRLESKAQKEIEHLWNHDHLKKEAKTLQLEEMDLFSRETAAVFGLTRNELLIAGATSGAATGAGIDLLFVGHTVFLGAAIGALAGAAGAFFGFNELSEIKVLGQTLGHHYVQMGPMENKNFPFILLGRAVYHVREMMHLSHAVRSTIDINMDSTFKEQWLDEADKKSLEAFHKMFRSTQNIDAKTLDDYEAHIKNILERLREAQA